MRRVTGWEAKSKARPPPATGTPPRDRWRRISSTIDAERTMTTWSDHATASWRRWARSSRAMRAPICAGVAARCVRRGRSASSPSAPARRRAEGPDWVTREAASATRALIRGEGPWTRSSSSMPAPSNEARRRSRCGSPPRYPATATSESDRATTLAPAALQAPSRVIVEGVQSCRSSTTTTSGTGGGALTPAAAPSRSHEPTRSAARAWMRERSTRRAPGHSGPVTEASSSSRSRCPAATHCPCPKRSPAAMRASPSIPASPARANRLRSSARKAGIARIWAGIWSGQGAGTDSMRRAIAWSWAEPVTSSTGPSGERLWVRHVETTW